MKIICIGDSMTYGFGVPVDENWVSLLNKNSNNIFINKGISGDTSGGMLARFKYDVIDEQPDWVFIMGGANDLIMGCEADIVKANIMAMVHQAYFNKIRAVIGIEISGDVEHIRKDWTPMCNFKEVESKLKQLRQWAILFGKTFNTPYIDLFDEYKKAIKHDKNNYYIDGMHPNRRGHKIIADIILEKQIF